MVKIRLMRVGALGLRACLHHIVRSFVRSRSSVRSFIGPTSFIRLMRVGALGPPASVVRVHSFVRSFVRSFRCSVGWSIDDRSVDRSSLARVRSFGW